MSMRAVTAITFALVCSVPVARAQGGVTSASPHVHGVSSYTIEAARVEEVLRVEDDGFNSVTYVITWKGSHVGVEDPLCETHYQVGDTIKFMVTRWHRPDNDGPKVLRFLLLDMPRSRT